jgi:hypothetical protein
VKPQSIGLGAGGGHEGVRELPLGGHLTCLLRGPSAGACSILVGGDGSILLRGDGPLCLRGDGLILLWSDRTFLLPA